ncbi:hypothetical protein NM688_g2430 [Phlebia brevispora]|uniref:Uncharacterized protein n=1 Tax=Phlebia brevispora TaxID=194682 RepID=A0ACC1T8I2_9APHY|nr:hypothetical protein NM688_g2430 [Phlebia brevispora]
MATQTYTFAVFAPDYTDPDALGRRLAVRTQHLANAKSLLQAGTLRIGGALISPETYDKPEKKLIGSLMIFEAANIDAIRKVIEDDIYYKTNVWDKEKLIILPWVSAAPLPPHVPE